MRCFELFGSTGGMPYFNSITAIFQCGVQCIRAIDPYGCKGNGHTACAVMGRGQEKVLLNKIRFANTDMLRQLGGYIGGLTKTQTSGTFIMQTAVIFNNAVKKGELVNVLNHFVILPDFIA